MYLRHVCVYFIAAGAVFASAGIAPKALEAFKIALRYHNSGDLQSASIHYRNALAHDPTLVSAAINLGIIHEKWHEPNEARKLYDESVQAAPQSFAARYNRGQFRQKQGDLAGARIDYEVASRLKKDASIHINLAAIELNLFEKKRDMELLFAAEKNIGAAEALKSKSPALYFNRARIMEIKNFPARARTLYTEALRYYPPKSAEYVTCLGRVERLNRTLGK